MNFKSLLVLLFALFVGALWALPAVASADDIVYAMDDVGNVSQYNAAGGLVATFNHAANTQLFDVYNFVASGNNLFVLQDQGFNNNVGAYQLSLSPTPQVLKVNTSFIPVPSAEQNQFPWEGIALFNGNLFVTDRIAGTVGEYTQAGTAVNTSFISGVSGAQAIVEANGDFFIGTSNFTIAEYTTAGTLVNSALIAGIQSEAGIAVVGGDLFVLSRGNGTVHKYDTSGNLISASLIPGLSSNASDIEPFDGKLLIANGNAIAEYDTSGNLINASFGTSPSVLLDRIVVIPTPEPATWILLAIGAASLLAFRRCRRS